MDDEEGFRVTLPSLPHVAVAVARTPGEAAKSLLGVGSEIGNLVRRERPVRGKVVPQGGFRMHLRGRAACFLRRLYATASARSDSHASHLAECSSHGDTALSSGRAPSLVGSGAVEMRRREKPPLRSPRSNGSRGVVIAAEELTRRFATGIVLAVGLGVAALLVPPVGSDRAQDRLACPTRWR
jgi:hypothetical protein